MEVYQIYQRHWAMVYRLCMLYLKNEQDAQDGVQNIFLKLLEKKIAFRDQEHEKAWLIRTTKNYCLDELRSGWHEHRAALSEWKEQPQSEQTQEENLLELVMGLPEKCREALYLYYYEEYSVKEIARITGRRESTIQSRLASGRKRIRKQIEQEGIYGREYLERCFRATES